ncbi:MAG: T9SS type A sorting domain-containing protein [Bacteroidia bacterium]
MATTNNKNILLWLQDDKGVEMDPHAHESQYFYSDVVKLMDSVGLAESKLMGGSIYNDSNGINIWTNLVNGQYGIVFPNKFWQPDYMMGGGTPNHVADLNYYGFWNPQDTANYLVHDTTSHLRHIGTGCSIKIKDTSSVAGVVTEINDVVQKVQSGQYPSYGFYLQTIFFEQGDLNSIMFYNKVLQVADSVNAIVASGNAQWKTLKEVYTLWDSAYNAQMFQWECGQVVSEIKENNKKQIRIFPNPFNDRLHLDFGQEPVWATIEITDLTGRLIDSFNTMEKQFDISTNRLCPGIYFLKVAALPGMNSVFKIVKE